MNVPKLRFKEFNDTWKKIQLSSFVNINPQNDSLPEKFIYIDLESVNNGLLTSRKIINRSEAPSRAKRTIIKNDILYQTVRPYQMNNLFINSLDSDYPYIASTGYALLRTKENPYFVYSILHQKSFVNKVLDMCTGTSYPAINATDLGKISVGLPSIKEQEKISRTLELLDKKIELQTKKIEDLKLFKLYMENQFIFKDDASYIEYKLRDILIEGNKTPVADTSKYQKLTIKLNLKGLEFNESQKEMSDKRPFYVRDENELIIGKQNYFNGSIAIVNKKYAGGICSNAIMSFKAKDGFDIKYIYLYLSQKSYMKQREFLANGTGQKELSEKEFLNFSIRIPTDNKVKKIIKNVNCISKKILLEENKLNKLIELKKGLMQNMFV
jgi:type I restriction enzyme S subunit